MLRRVTTTVDSLARIIQTLSGGSMSGHLIARRENRKNLEEGEIIFAQGKIIAARAAYRLGVDALNWMKTWRDCAFAFHPSEESKHIPVLTSGVLHDETPTGARMRSMAAALGKDHLVRRLSGEQGKRSETSEQAIAWPEAMFPGIVPHRTEIDEKALNLLKTPQYSRMHRHIFLLVDGHRSILELIRLTGRDHDDVVTCLRDLEKLKIIHIPR